MQFFEALSRATDISPAAQRVVDELLANPTDAAFWSAAELAERAGVHEATAVRLAQQLGFRGFPGLRKALQEDMRQRVHPAERVERSLAHLDGAGVLDRYVDEQLTYLRDLPAHVSQDALDAAARAIGDAAHVYVFAHGHATALAALMERRLRRSGLRCSSLRGSGRELAEQAVSMDSSDLLIAYALRTEPPYLTTLLEIAGEAGTSRLLITDTVGPRIRPTAEHLLAAPRGAAAEFQSLAVPMAITDALVLNLARLDEGRSLEHLNRLSGLLDRLE